MKVFRTLVAFIYAIVPFVGLFYLALIIYESIQTGLGIFLFLSITVLGFLMSRFTFNMMRKRGVIELLSHIPASYDLDQLVPTDYSNLNKYSAQELVEAFDADHLKIKKGTIRIWGDWEGRSLDQIHTIASLNYTPERQILSIFFTDDFVLKVRRPTLIFECESYLKITSATEVLWQVPKANFKHPSNYQYLKLKNGIKTKSNMNWNPHRYDVGLGDDAVYIQNL
ncbi:MAG: hypothetical protein ACI837_002400 [Crocinitomicaceae bacterium]|jgi:hypothetical protein